MEPGGQGSDLGDHDALPAAARPSRDDPAKSAVDGRRSSARAYRTIPAEVQGVQPSENVGDMDFNEFAGADRVFRGSRPGGAPTGGAVAGGEPPAKIKSNFRRVSQLPLVATRTRRACRWPGVNDRGHVPTSLARHTGVPSHVSWHQKAYVTWPSWQLGHASWRRLAKFLGINDELPRLLASVVGCRPLVERTYGHVPPSHRSFRKTVELCRTVIPTRR